MMDTIAEIKAEGVHVPYPLDESTLLLVEAVWTAGQIKGTREAVIRLMQTQQCDDPRVQP